MLFNTARSKPTRSGPYLFAALLFGLTSLAGLNACGGATPLPCPDSNIDFAEHIEPRLQRDCTRCHNTGQDGVKISGEQANDYSEISRYVVPSDAEKSELLDWAAGKDKHPVNWSRGSLDCACVARWIDEGAVEKAEIDDAGRQDLDAGANSDI